MWFTLVTYGNYYSLIRLTRRSYRAEDLEKLKRQNRLRVKSHLFQLWDNKCDNLAWGLGTVGDFTCIGYWETSHFNFSLYLYIWIFFCVYGEDSKFSEDFQSSSWWKKFKTIQVEDISKDLHEEGWLKRYRRLTLSFMSLKSAARYCEYLYWKTVFI